MIMKISWGHKILFTYLTFATGIMLLVYLSSRENRDLVTDNYYAEELAYQQVIDQSANTAALSGPVAISATEEAVNIVFPDEFKKILSEGTWSLYFAADRSKDTQGNFTTSNGNYHIPLNSGMKGQFTIKLQWKAEGKEYYFEQPLFL